MQGLRDIKQLNGLPVLVRAALNVPVENGVVTNTFRLRQALPTIQYLQQKGAKVILCGHIGDQGTETFLPVFQALKEFLPHITFSPVSIGREAHEAVNKLRPGDVLLLENLRRNRGEKLNDPEFAKELASLADLFVEDSFDVCHRPHASVVGVPALLPSYAGLLVDKEVQQLRKALSPKKPALAIIAGAKFSTKEPVILALLSNYSNVFIGGALANDFLQAKGYAVGKSLVSDSNREEITSLLTNTHLITPIDVRVGVPGAPAENKTVVDAAQIPAEMAVFDVGPASVQALAPLIAKAKTILWNGTLGLYEDGYVEATSELARLITSSKAYSVLGGGDTVAALENLNLIEGFSFVSTGGGAMLDFLAYGKLPGIDALGGTGATRSPLARLVSALRSR